MSELPKAYSPADAESRWYNYWYDHSLFDAKVSDRTPFVVAMPPPNVTGILTLGHVLNHTIQDIYIRWHRMRGFEACWIPGMDHAGIATQAKVVAALKEEGIDYKTLGREGFLERVWEWKENYGSIILQQLRTLGVSADWRRERFTLDESLSEAVADVFIRLYDDGLIYRGKKIINWSPAGQTTVSDEEVDHREVNDKLYTLRYHLEDGSGTITVATARPETLFGDVAVAVNPSDERYTDMIGKRVIVPLAGHLVEIIADEYPDPAFGSGAVKITPAHDVNDYEVGLRHGLPMPNTINRDATMNDLAGPLAGMDRFDARRAAVKLLESLDLIEKVVDYTHSVGYSQRGGEQIEPFLSDEWFVRMEPLAEPALAAVRNGEIKFHPEHWVKTYEHWMTNVRDWPISRQLWWGHRIPVYYLEDGRYTAARSEVEAREKLGVPPGTPIRQDEDVLDTWFSSWLWPFSVHGWGSHGVNSEELAYFYPTNLLVTGPDIIFFWVARMIMAGLEFMRGELTSDGASRTAMSDIVPFKDVYFTSMVRDMQGRKMSKSLGNSPDPLTVMRDYGSDAVRFTIVYQAPSGQDVRFSAEACELGRNFANKLWNAGRFLLMKRDEVHSSPDPLDSPEIPEAYPAMLPMLEPVSDSDRWILSRFHSALQDVNDALGSFRINEYTKLLYDFVWRDFCDWYVEQFKSELASAADSPERSASMVRFALGLYDQVLRMLHPVMPFVTEEIWQNLSPRESGEAIAVAPFPVADRSIMSAEIEKEFAILQDLVESIRRMRNEANVAPSKGVTVTVRAADEATRTSLARMETLLGRLARIETLNISSDATKPQLSSAEVVRDIEVFVHLEGLIDVEKERQKTEKEITRLEGQIKGIESKLSNEKFVANAPADVVDKEREKLQSYRDTVEKLRGAMSN